MGVSKFDLFYRTFILTKFYTRGWGSVESIREIFRLQNIVTRRAEALRAVSADHQVHIESEVKTKDFTRIRGSFVSPMTELAPSIMPEVVRQARFEMIIPPGGTGTNIDTACIHLAGTGDHGYNRRRELIAKPLLKHGIASLMLENPFYGSRKPKEQWRSGLLYVNDLFVMGSCLILETLVLLHWLKNQGYTQLGVSGVSMGGHMASLAGTNWPGKLAVVPCMSWTSASVVWCDGVLSKSIPWRLLEKEYSKDARYEEEIKSLLVNGNTTG